VIMLRIFVKFNNEVTRIFDTDELHVTIGRSPNNDIQIDNLAVSSEHALIIKSDDRYFIEDLNSTNGTYVNEKKIDKRWPINTYDTVTIGKHALAFEMGDNFDTVPQITRKETGRDHMDQTMILETKRQHELNERARGVQDYRIDEPPPGRLIVKNGSMAKKEYELTGNLSLIGKDTGADIRLEGWLAPKIAGFVHRDENGYSLIPPQKQNKIRLNGKRIDRSEKLNPDDVISVGGVKLLFKPT